MASDKDLAYDLCLSLAGRIATTKVRIYNVIREVGYGKLSADRALHQFIEDYHELGRTLDSMHELADKINELPVTEESDE